MIVTINEQNAKRPRATSGISTAETLFLKQLKCFEVEKSWSLVEHTTSQLHTEFYLYLFMKPSKSIYDSRYIL